jgi:hypothetical protein
MAITNTGTIFQGQNLFICTITAGADGDTTADIAHGLSGAPTVYFIIPAAGGAAAFAALCQYNITLPTATKVTVNKVGTAGTAATSAAVLVVMRPHSIIG